MVSADLRYDGGYLIPLEYSFGRYSIYRFGPDQHRTVADRFAAGGRPLREGSLTFDLLTDCAGFYRATTTDGQEVIDNVWGRFFRFDRQPETIAPLP